MTTIKKCIIMRTIVLYLCSYATVTPTGMSGLGIRIGIYLDICVRVRVRVFVYIYDVLKYFRLVFQLLVFIKPKGVFRRARHYLVLCLYSL